MAFRKKVKKIFSKLGQHSNKPPSNSGTTSTDGISDDVAALPPPRSQIPTARPPPLISKKSVFPQAVSTGYHPSGVVAEYPGQSSSIPNDITPIEEIARHRENGDGETKTREDGYTLLHPGIETGPQYIRDFDEGTSPQNEDGLLKPGVAEERKTSQATMYTTASSDYDQHSLTQSLRNTPVPAPGAQLMQNHREQSPSLPPISSLHISEEHETSRSSPTPSPGPNTISEITDISHSLAPPVVHNKVVPITKEELLHVRTIEHHHHHIQPRIQPVVDTQILPPKHYLETAPGWLEEITAQEATQYGEPIWSGETVVAADNVGKLGLDPTAPETVRTRLPTPRAATPRRVAEPILPLPGEDASFSESIRGEKEGNGVVSPMAKLLGNEVERRGSPSMPRMATFGRAGVRERE